MVATYVNLVLSALAELADVAYQERVWAGFDAAEMSSFVECVESLFDDSGLTQALADGSVFGDPVDEQLRVLSVSVESVDADQPVTLLLIDPMLAECRHLAETILRNIPTTARSDVDE